jgi:trans-aconitate 2-methyltransferase
MSWSPEQYLRFEQPRLRPAFDLLARVALESPERICDLGCGTGSMTRVLAERWPQAQIFGVDASASMLSKARESQLGIEWIEADLGAWTPPAALDLIYSNAALHWLDDHARLFAKLVSMLRPGGVLAVQMPANFNAPSHTSMADAAHDGPWRATLAPLLKSSSPVAEAARYYEFLAPVMASVDIWETVYLQVLTGADPVKEWTKGTWLGPLLAALEPGQREAFEANYAARVRAAYTPRADGRTLFPFRRLFIVARRA